MSKKQVIGFSKQNFILQAKGKADDNYTKIQELGMGGFSKVFKVENNQTHEVLACKEILKKKIVDITRFHNEVNIMSKCDHPNIVQLKEIYENSRYVDLIMEECRGGNLFDRMIKKMDEEDELFSEKEIAVIFKQIMSAINYCHNQGICHRDLKLENVLFVTNKEDSPIKIIDFGLSFIFGEPFSKNNKAKMQTFVGTNHYMSPEVIKGNYNEKCDIWSAGVMLYILLSGIFPFDGNTDKEVFKAIKSKKYSFPEEEWNGVSKEAKDLIKHMLCEEKERYSAQMVLNHPWFKKLAPDTTSSMSKLSVKNLKKYQNNCGLKKFVITYVASRMGDKEIHDLNKLFCELDTNKDGTLTFEEIKSCLMKMKNNLNDEELNSIFKGIDTNNSLRIEYTEFISAALEEKEYLQEEKLIAIFKLLDKDKSGKISKKEIKNALNNEKVDDEDIKLFIQKFDLDGDGEIDYNEFVSCMSEIKENA